MLLWVGLCVVAAPMQPFDEPPMVIEDNDRWLFGEWFGIWLSRNRDIWRLRDTPSPSPSPSPSPLDHVIDSWSKAYSVSYDYSYERSSGSYESPSASDPYHMSYDHDNPWSRRQLPMLAQPPEEWP